jgi:hypothetical protein
MWQEFISKGLIVSQPKREKNVRYSKPEVTRIASAVEAIETATQKPDCTRPDTIDTRCSPQIFHPH